jgi:hypothetical protein
MNGLVSWAMRMGPALGLVAVLGCGATAGFGCSSRAPVPAGKASDGSTASDVSSGSTDVEAAAGSTEVVDSGIAGETRGSGGAGGVAASGGASGQAGGASGQAGGNGSCPTAAPFDDSNPAVVSDCAVPIAVAVGNGLRRALTHDGKTWDHDVYLPDSGADQNENSHRDVLIARGLIFVVGDGGLLVSKDGGETFAVGRAGRFHDSALVSFQGLIWAISNLGTFSTTDGSTWKEYAGTSMLPGNLPGAFSASGGAAVASGSLLLVVSGRQSSARLFDGTSWTQHDFDPATFGSLTSAAHGNDRFVILGGACCDKMAFAGLRATSSDGIAWIASSNATAGSAVSLRFGSVLWQGMHFFATASQYDKRTYTSTDGLAWTAQPSNVGIGSVTLFKGAYEGINGASIYSSPDGAAWSLVHNGVGDQKSGYSIVRAGYVLAH